MKLSLVVLTPGKQEGKALPITLSQFVIGRDPQCHLRPASAAISKRHCALLTRDGKIFVRDFDSTNGTFVNDEPVKGEVELNHDDRLKVGPLLFAVQIEQTTAASTPTPPPPTKKAAAPAKASAPEGQADKKPEAKKAQGDKAAKPKQPARTAAELQSDEDDSIAAMLMSLQDDSDTSSYGEVPEGSTVMDLVVPPGMGEEKKDDKSEMAKVKASQANTSTAAKAILEKYMKRPR